MPSKHQYQPSRSSRDGSGWQLGEHDSFDRLAAFSAWLLLVFYDDESDEYGGLEDSPSEPPSWGIWKRLNPSDPKEFEMLLHDVILPDIEKRYAGTSHPLSLFPDAARSLFSLPFLSMHERALDCCEPGSVSEIKAIWDYWDETAEHYYEGLPCAPDLTLKWLLEEIMKPEPGQKVLDLHPGVGEVASRLCENSSKIHMVVDDPVLGAMAAASVLLQGYSTDDLEVSRRVGGRTEGDLPPSDVVIARPPWAVLISPEGSRKGKVRSEFFAMEQVMMLLKPGGRAAVHVPHSFLFGSGKNKQLRERLLTEFSVDAVVNIPARPRRPKSALILFRNAPPRDRIWIIPEQDFSDATEGDWNSPWEQALHAALEVRMGMEPVKTFEDGETLRGDSWLARIQRELEREISSLSEGGNTLDDPLGEDFLRIARGEPTDISTLDRLNLVSIDSIARRDFELITKPSNLASYEKFLSVASEIPGAKIRTLGEIATIKRGIWLSANKMRDDEKPSDIFYLRVSDLPKNFKGSRFLSSASKTVGREAVLTLREEAFAQVGDIVLSINGTIGKSAIVEPGTLAEFGFKILPSSGLAIIRLKESSPQQTLIVANVLMSSPYRQLLSSLSLGSTVQHLRLAELRNIRIPVLPHAERLKLSEAIETGDSFEFLADALKARSGYTRALKQLLESSAWVAFAKADLNMPSDHNRQLLRDLVSDCKLGAVSGNDHEDPFFQWTVEFGKAARELEEILEYDPGSDQLAALQGWRSSVSGHGSEFRKTWEHLRHRFGNLERDGDGSWVPATVFKRCETLYSNLLKLADLASQDLFDSVQITASLSPGEVEVGTETIATIRVRNRGALPLRKFSVDGDGVTEKTIPLLRVGGAYDWSVSLNPEKHGKFSKQIRWMAVRLNNEPAAGAMELVATAAPSNSVREVRELGSNPYVYARVLDEKTENVFKGRKKAISGILSAIDRPSGSTIILIEGNRRIGKTSLLRYFIRNHLPTDKIAVFVNFQEFDGLAGKDAKPGIPTVSVFQGMTREVIRAAAEAVPDLHLPDLGPAPSGSGLGLISYCRKAEKLIDPDSPFQSFQHLLDAVREAVAPRALLFVLDEFDRLQEGIQSGITSDQVPENLRHLFQTRNDIAGIFTGSRTIRRLRQDYWSILFGLGRTIRLSGLTQKEAIELIEDPVRGRIVYASDAVDEICRLTARQPLLLQGMCDQLFVKCSSEGTRAVSLSDVRSVASIMAADNEHFESIWTYAGTDRRRLIVFLIDQQERDMGGATFERIQELLEENGLKPTATEVHADLEELEDLEVINRSQGRALATYKIEVPLFSRWLNATKDISQYRAAAIEE